jgi:iron complex outermembrane recepter protein
MRRPSFGLAAVAACAPTLLQAQTPAAEPAATPAAAASAPAAESALPVVKVTGTAPARPTAASTGTRTEAPLADVPQTVNVVPAETLRERGTLRISEVAETVPGVHGGTGYGGMANGYGFYIRGFGSYTNYRDGFRDFSFISPRDVSLFERVEVLKGPASVLYGTNDPGGIVNFISKRPRFDSARELTLTLGSFDARRASVDLTGPLDEARTLAWRLVLTHDERDSHRDFVSSRTQLAAPSLTWQPDPDTSVTLLAETVRQHYTFERGFLAEQEFIDLPRERFLEEPGLNRARARGERYAIDLQRRLNEQWSLRAALSSIKPRIEKLNFYPLALQADRRTFDRALDYSVEHSNDQALQVELTGRLAALGLRHTLLAGAEFYRDNFHYTFAPFDVISSIDIYSPVYGQVVIPPGTLETIAFGNDYGSRTTSIYLQDQIEFTSRWKATVGARYDHSRLFNDDLVTPDASLRRQTQARVSPRAGVVFQPDPATSLFAGYSTSFKPQIFVVLANGELARPEIGRQFELGWRQQWLGGAIDSTLSVFELRKRNVNTSDPANPLQSIQVGEQRSRGAELELRGQPVRGLDVTLATAWVDARVTRDNTLPVGDRLDSAPRESATLWLKWKPASLGWFVGGGVVHVGEREGTLPNNGVKLPAETRLDALLGYDAGRWEAQLNGRNLTDERLYVPYSGLFIPGPGRSVDLALSLRF